MCRSQSINTTIFCRVGPAMRYPSVNSEVWGVTFCMSHTNSPQQGICLAHIQLFKILPEMISSHPDYFLGVPQCGASAACFHWCAITVVARSADWRMVSQYARKQLFHRLHGIYHLAWSLCLVICTCSDHCRSREHFWSNEMQPKVCSWVQTLNPYFLHVGIRCGVSLGQISQLSGKYI